MRRLIMACVLAVVPGLSFAQIAPSPDAPPCASHDPRAWHGLWNEELGCHYDHQHGDDPSSVNDIFGTSLFDLMGGSISHPWQTFSAAGYENDLKHAGYFWHVQRDLPCATDGCLRAFRILIHQHPSGLDAPVRFHSMAGEFQTFDPATGQVGYLQAPGRWIDFGHLLVDGVRAIDVGPTAEPGRHKQHQSFGAPQNIWYGADRRTHTPDTRGRLMRGFLSISTSNHDVWDHTSAADPGNATDYVCYPAANCTANATLSRPHAINVDGSAARSGINRQIADPDGNGVIDGVVWTDRYGVPLHPGTCSAPSLDCVPNTFQNVRVDKTYSCDSICAQKYTEHDIYFNGRTSGWSQPRP